MLIYRLGFGWSILMDLLRPAKIDNYCEPKMAHSLKLVYQLKCSLKRVLSSSYGNQSHQTFSRPCEVLLPSCKRVIGPDLQLWKSQRTNHLARRALINCWLLKRVCLFGTGFTGLLLVTQDMWVTAITLSMVWEPRLFCFAGDLCDQELQFSHESLILSYCKGISHTF